MLAGGQGRRGLRVMQVIRRGDMDHIDPRVGQHGLEALVGRRQAECGGAFRSPGMAGPNHAMHLNAKPAQGFDMDRTDEARPYDRGADFRDRSWRRPFSHRDFVREALTFAGLVDNLAKLGGASLRFGRVGKAHEACGGTRSLEVREFS